MGFIKSIGLVVISVFPILVGFLFISSTGGCGDKSATAPVTVTQVAYATPPPNTLAGRDWNYATLSAPFGYKLDGASVTYNGLIWEIAGGVYGFSNDVWSSADGINWTSVLASNASPGPNQFPPRQALSCLVYNGKMWVIGGGNTSYLNDVWSSIDGMTWTQVLANNNSPGPNQFAQRKGQTCLVYNNKMWVIGGYTTANPFNDVWSSSDGVTWTKVLADTASPTSSQFSRRSGATGLSYNGSMWLISGQTAGGISNDVWSSTDGITWTPVLANNNSPGPSQFPQRSYQTSVVYGNAMWVIGGYDLNGLNDVWYSTNGQYWTEMTASAAFPGRYGATSVVFNNRLWLIGGTYNSSIFYSDVWYSPF